LLLLIGKCAFKFYGWQKFFIDKEGRKEYCKKFELFCKLFNLSLENLPTIFPTVLY
jgi:hypothetical protein